jgi:hypothetical protein
MLRSLLVGVLLLGGLLAVMSRHEATSAAPPAAEKDAKDKDKDKAADKDKTVKEVSVRWPDPIKLTLVAKSDEELSSLTEMVSAVNKLSEAKWKENKIVPSNYANDYEFIRRASLDIIGRVAKPEEIREFMKDPKEARRSKLINRLLESDEYPKHWADLWSNWLLGRSGVFGRGKYHEWLATWLEDQFSQNKSYSGIVKSLLTASGENDDTDKGGAAVNFILAHVGENVPADHRGEEGYFQFVPLTSRITRLFLGTQVQCAQCHDHPFYSNIKQEHFWGVNAFLRQVKPSFARAPQMGRMMTFNKLTLLDDANVAKNSLVYFEKRNGVILTARPEFLPSNGDEKHGSALPPDAQGRRRREMLSEFIIDHPQFPKAIANRMWGVFFGRGFVNPVDDFNDQNQPSNEELLNEMAAKFKHYNYDLKRLIRWICNSNPYNLSYVANRTNDKPEQEALFSRMIMKAMSPEQLFESIVTAAKLEKAESKDGKKALRDQWLGSLITNFGDDEGNEVNFNGTVVQALMMMNGKDINDAISRKDGSVALAIRSRTEMAAIHELYLTALNRPPSSKEYRTILSQFRLHDPRIGMSDLRNPNRRYEDLFWALLNSNEFILNH